MSILSIIAQSSVKKCKEIAAIDGEVDAVDFYLDLIEILSVAPRRP